MANSWAPRPAELPAQTVAASQAAPRREAVSAAFPGDRLVIPAGQLQVRSNDCDYIFRPHSAFAHLTGLGADREPDAVLVLDPTDSGHDSLLYFRPRAERDTEEFYSDARYGELWVGVRPSLAEISAELGLQARHLDQLASDLAAGRTRIVPDADPRIEALTQTDPQHNRELATMLAELRLRKDPWEVEQLRQACAATVAGFEAIVRGIPEAVARGRGERWIEGLFARTARNLGNDVGYSTIAASGEHACTLHWIRNDGDLVTGQLLLVDAGVEVDSLYTADVTRTLPISGRFSEPQRQVYEAVLRAQEAGLAAVKPGNTFKDIHQAAIEVIAQELHDWGLLPAGVDLATALSPAGGHHRRWMVHGTSHHLGLDVHDCAQARREQYLDGILEPGMVLTVEPGLYFKTDDLLVPPQFRGIGVRIEDDVLVTASGHENLSAGLPRASAEVESWMSRLWA